MILVRIHLYVFNRYNKNHNDNVHLVYEEKKNDFIKTEKMIIFDDILEEKNCL